jgi:hypothetical protein
MLKKINKLQKENKAKQKKEENFPNFLFNKKYYV